MKVSLLWSNISGSSIYFWEFFETGKVMVTFITESINLGATFGKIIELTGSK